MLQAARQQRFGLPTLGLRALAAGAGAMGRQPSRNLGRRRLNSDFCLILARSWSLLLGQSAQPWRGLGSGGDWQCWWRQRPPPRHPGSAVQYQHTFNWYKINADHCLLL